MEVSAITSRERGHPGRDGRSGRTDPGLKSGQEVAKREKLLWGGFRKLLSLTEPAMGLEPATY